MVLDFQGKYIIVYHNLFPSKSAFKTGNIQPKIKYNFIHHLTVYNCISYIDIHSFCVLGLPMPGFMCKIDPYIVDKTICSSCNYSKLVTCSNRF